MAPSPNQKAMQIHILSPRDQQAPWRGTVGSGVNETFRKSIFTWKDCYLRGFKHNCVDELH